MSNSRLFVANWFKKAGKSARDATKDPKLFSTLYLDYLDILQNLKFKSTESKVRPLTAAILEHAYNEYVSFRLKEDLSKALVNFICEQENMEKLHQWIKALTGKVDPKDVCVIAHWLWMVKRKAYGMTVKHHIMPVLYGSQGTGKSVALENLINPIEEYRLSIRMDQLADERVFEGLAHHFIVVFDELQGVERTDMNALKKQITTTYNSYRKLHTHALVNVPMRCSFIGASNKAINESFTDSTGMRRFWEVACSEQIDWDVITSLDYTALWQGINEKLESGYLTGPMLQEVSTAQLELVNKEDVDEFIVETALKSKDATLFKEICHEELYETYTSWTGRVGARFRLSSSVFGKKLKKRLPNRTVKNAHGVEKRIYAINTNSEVMPSSRTEKLLKESSDGQH